MKRRVDLTVEVRRLADNLWLASVSGLLCTQAYGYTRDQAIRFARMAAERMCRADASLLGAGDDDFEVVLTET